MGGYGEPIGGYAITLVQGSYDDSRNVLKGRG